MQEVALVMPPLPLFVHKKPRPGHVIAFLKTMAISQRLIQGLYVNPLRTRGLTIAVGSHVLGCEAGTF